MTTFSEMASTHETDYREMQFSQRAAPTQNYPKTTTSTLVSGKVGNGSPVSYTPIAQSNGGKNQGMLRKRRKFGRRNFAQLELDEVRKELDYREPLPLSPIDEESEFVDSTKEFCRHAHKMNSKYESLSSLAYHSKKNKRGWAPSTKKKNKDGGQHKYLMNCSKGVYDAHSGEGDSISLSSHPVLQQFMNKMDVIAAQLYVMSRLGDDIAARILSVHTLVRVLFPHETDLSHVYTLFTKIVTPDEPQSGGDSWSASLRDLLSNWKLLKSHPLGASISTLLSACVVLGLVGPGKFHFSIGDLELFSKTVKAKHVTAVDVFDAMVETVVYFFEVGHAILETKSLTPLLFMTAKADELSIEVSFLKANAASASNGSISSICPDCSVDQYRDRLAACLSKLSDCISALAKGCYERYVMQRKYEELELIQSRFLAAQAASCQRLRPYAGMVWASSGVGKTTFVRDTVIYALSANGFDSSDNKIITVSDTDKYDSTLRSDIEAIIDDDVANQKPKFAPMSAAARIINIVNSKPYAANMAAVEDKGKVSCNAKVYFLSTNHPTLDAYETSNCPSSVLCRFQICVSITVKPEFCTSGTLGAIGMQLDSRKVFARYGDVDVDNEPHALDVWNITVKRPYVKPSTTCGQEGIGYEVAEFEGRAMQDVDYATYLKFICHDTQQYFSNQRKLLNKSLNVTDRIHKCSHGVPLIASCSLCVLDADREDEAEAEEEQLNNDHMEPQSGALIGTTLGWFLRSWVNGATRKFSSLVVGEIREMEFATTRALFDFCKEWKQSWLNTWTDYIPDSLLHTFIGRYAIKRAIKMRNAREILCFRMCFFIYAILVARAVYFKVWYYPIVVAILIPLVYSYKIFVDTINMVVESELLARRDAISDASRHVREMYVSRAVKFVGIAGVLYTSVCVLREFIKAGRQVTNGIVFAPFGLREHCVNPTSVRIVAPSGNVLHEKSIVVPNILKKIDDAVEPTIVETHPHGNLVPQSPDEILERSREINVYKKVVTVPLQCCSRVKTSTHAEVVNRLHKHLVHFSLAVGDKWRVTNGLIITSRLLLVPYHILFDNQNSLTGNMLTSFNCKITRRDCDAVGGEFYNRFFTADLHKLPGCDLVLIHMPAIGTARSCVYLFPEGGSFSGPTQLVYRNLLGEICNFAASVTYAGSVRHTGCDPFKGGYSEVAGGTFKGLCIAPYVSLGKSPGIVGLHLGGVSGHPRGIYGVVTQQDLSSAILVLEQRLSTSFSVQGGDVPSSIMGVAFMTSDTVHPKCPTQFMTARQCDVKVFGSCIGKATFRPTITTSLLSPFVEEIMGVPQKWGNPSTHPWKFERTFLENCGNPGVKLDTDALEWAAKDWTEGLLRRAKDFDLKYSKLADIAAVSGIDGTKWIDSMNLGSAVGFPLTGKKRDYLIKLDPLEWPEWNCPHALGAELQQEKDRIMHAYKQRERAYPIFKSCPKSESIPLSKDKKRLFQVAPTGFQVVVRQYFLPLAVLMSQFPLLSECSVGINCASDEWEQMQKFLERFPSSNTIAGDYKAYDQVMGPDVTRKAWECLLHLAVELGASEEDASVMECIISDMVSPVLAFDGTLIELNASNPSGQNLTAHLNCVVNSLLLRVVWYVLYKRRGLSPPPFREHVSLQVYGDDNLATTDDLDFNMKNISAVLGEAGYIYTDAQKNLDVVPFIDLVDAEYLKRKSCHHEALGIRVGALHIDSIFKSLHCFDKHSAISMHEHACAVVESALGELFLHGRDVYELRREELARVVSQAGLVVPALNKDYYTKVAEWHEHYSQDKKVTTGGALEALILNDALHSSEAAGFALMGLKSRNTRRPGNCFKNQGPEDSDSSLQGLVHTSSAQELDGSEFSPHSGNVTFDVGSGSHTTWHQTVQYEDGEPGAQVSVPGALRSDTIGGDTNQLSLGDFFKRPILLHELLWQVGEETNLSFEPWVDFLSQSRIQNRINNYARLRGTLRLKFTISGNGFYYGRMIAAYLPMSGLDALDAYGQDGIRDVVELSQRPHVLLDPTTSTGGELHIPFLFQKEAFDVVNQDWTGNGRIDLYGITGLGHAGGFGGPVKVSIFAWSDDLELSAPTSQNIVDLAPQSGEISGTGCPPFASWSEAAGGESHVKKPYNNTIVDQKPVTMSQTALCDVATNVPKLSVTKDQGVTVDTRVMGLDGNDEMDITSIATRQTFVTTTTWTPYLEPGSILFSSAVHPAIAVFGNGEKAKYHFTAMANMSMFFAFWRGTIKFRFVVAGSAFHRGRLKVAWDPVKYTDNNDLNTGYNCIVDIAEQKDFTIEVGWGSKSGMLKCLDIAGQPVQFSTDDTVLEPELRVANGVLRLEVFDFLTLPSDVFTDIQVMVFASAGDDIVFSSPLASSINSFTVFEPQSGSVMISPDDVQHSTDNDPESSNVIASFATPPNNIDKAIAIYCGERVSSLRTLLQRMAIHSYRDRTATGDRIAYDAYTAPTYPNFRGADPLGFSQEFGNPYTHSTNIPLQWAMLSFVGYRGAMRVHTVSLDTTTSFYTFITRRTFGLAAFGDETGQVSDGKALAAAAYITKKTASGFTGNHSSINPCVEAEIPYQNNVKFLPCRRKDQLTLASNPYFNYFEWTHVGNLNSSNERLGSLLGFSVGPDFQLGFYIGLPPMYVVEETYP